MFDNEKYPLPPLLIHCLLENKDGQWLAFSLEFGLAAQADTRAEAKAFLERMIETIFMMPWSAKIRNMLLCW